MIGTTKKLARRISPWLKSCCIALVASTCMLTTAQNWELVWSDEFNGPNIDTSKWSHEVNGDGGGNNELQYYTARTNNSFIENGHLVIQALKENYNGKAYTSARLRTLNKGDWTYGRFEARMKLPYGQGLWPAFWMLPTDWVYGGWAASGEIDIMENIGSEPSRVHGTLHYGGSWPNNTYSGAPYDLPSGNVYSTFHTYAVEWEPGQFRWYVDGVHYQTQTSWYSDAGAYPAPFNQRFHMLLNVAVGGNWPGSPNGSTVFPQRMEVDYVRVYSTTNTNPSTSTPYSGTPLAIPGTIETEDYDNGGQGVAYSDTGAANEGGSYRPAEGVDIEACSDSGGGYNVGWTATGEWMKYTVDVAPAGDYTITSRVAKGTTGTGAFHIEVDGVDVTGSISVSNTGGWQSWVNKTTSNVTLSSGEQVVEIVIESGGININRLQFVLDQAANTAPVFTADPINKPNAVEGSAYSDTIAGSATDVDAGDILSFSLVPGGPGWLNVATNGDLTGMPGNADVGLNSWTVQVSDGNGGTDTAILRITVNNVNDAPVFTTDPITKPNAVEDSNYAIPVSTLAGSATDVDAGTTLTYSKISGPSWLTVHSSGLLYGIPSNADVGLNSWTVQVSDGNGGIDTAILNITVNNVNDAPVFAPDPINKPNAEANSAYSDNIADSASDVDAGDILSFSLVLGGPVWLNVATNGVLSGIPSNSDVGLNSWTVQVSDGSGGTDTATLNITVDSALAPPSLSIQVSGPSFEILWPASYVTYSLYSSTNLLPPIVWSSVTNTPVSVGDDWVVTLPIVEAPQFFRLQNP